MVRFSKPHASRSRSEYDDSSSNAPAVMVRLKRTSFGRQCALKSMTSVAMTSSFFVSHHLPDDGRLLLNESYASNSSTIVESPSTSFFAVTFTSVTLVCVSAHSDQPKGTVSPFDARVQSVPSSRP